MVWMRVLVFWGHSFSMLLVMLSIPGAPLGLQVDSADSISSKTT